MAVSPERRRFLHYPARLSLVFVGVAAEDRIEHTCEHGRRIGGEIVAAPGDVEVRPDEHAPALGDLAERGPVVVEVEYPAAGTDHERRDRHARAPGDRRRGVRPTLAADAGEQREATLAGE